MDAWIICTDIAAACCALGSVLARKPETESRLTGLAAAAYAILGLADAAGRDWGGTCFFLAVAALWFWLWRRNRRKRKRSLRQLGHKARARLAAMVRNMPKPGPVLRPVPQGGEA